MADSFNSWSGFTAAQGSGAFQNWAGQAYSGFIDDLSATEQGPDAPTAVSANPRDASAVVSWTAPAAHDAVITSYLVFASTGQVQTLASGGTFTGLANGVAVTFTVRAVSGVAIGPASAASNSVTPSDVVVPPDAPTIGTAVAGDTEATLTWTDNGDGGAAITSHDIVSSPATTTQHFSSGGTFTGLTNGVAYTFTVKAVNSAGASSASAASNSVTPAGSYSPPANTLMGAAAAADILSWAFPISATAALNATNYLGTPNAANTMTASAGSGEHYWWGNNLLSGPAAVTYGFAAKAGTVSFASLDPTSSTDYVVFDLSLGTVALTGGAATGAIHALGGGWYWCEVITSGHGNAAPRLRMADTAAHAVVGGGGWTASGTETVFVGPFAAY